MKFNKVVTGVIRFNYVSIEEAKKIGDDLNERFGVTILIQKSDKYTTDKIYSALSNATCDGLNIWDGKVPKDIITCLKDGDLTNKEEYKNHFYINANSKYRPQVVDENLNQITDLSQIYNGCYGRASMNFYPYNHIEGGNCGIGCNLLNIQKLKDGEKIINISSAVDDFKDFDFEEDIL